MDKANTIVLYTTGGTISSVYDADSGTIIPELTGEQLIEHIRPVLGDIDVELNDMEIRPGPHMTPKFVLGTFKADRRTTKKARGFRSCCNTGD